MPHVRTDRADYRFLFGGFATLLVVSFLDNARGPLIPVLLASLNIPYETAGLFLTVGNIAAVAATFLLGRALQRWGERRVAIWVCFVSTLPGLLAPWVEGRWLLLLLGLLLGAAVALLGSLCSILTVKGSPPLRTARYVSFQQVMYGVGSLTAPLVFSALIAGGKPWWWLLSGSAFSLFALGAALIRVLPQLPPEARAIERREDPLSRSQMLVVLMFAMYVGGEVLASMWMSSLLVAEQGLNPSDAAGSLMYFFIIMAVTRFMCFLWVKPRYETRVLTLSLLCGIVLSVLGQQGYAWALPAMGIMGPFFPLCMARLSARYPKNWRQMMIFVYAGMQITLALMHVSVGKIADQVGMKQAFLLSPIFLSLCALCLWAARDFRGRVAVRAA